MNNKLFYTLAAVVIAASTFFWIFMFRTSPAQGQLGQPDASGETIELTMYHADGCECCVKWADYLVDHGFDVTREKVADLQTVKDERGVPNEVSSCHTAVAGGYVIEGHVPAEDIRRLLSEKPDAVGLAVPGMPASSPGMDMPSTRTWYSVLFDGETSLIYNTHR